VSRRAIVVGAVLLVPLTLGVWWWLPHGPTPIQSAMLAAARSGEFGGPVDHNSYSGEIDCSLYKANGFHGADIYLCQIGETNGWWQWETGALLKGQLHTHQSDPKQIPLVTPPVDALPFPLP
jgi:hypothetical protein